LGGGVVAEDPYKLRPTLVDICCRITAAVAFAEIYAESHPQHADALHHFSKDIRQSFRDLREVVYGKPIME
jgi:hypothetical protein